VAGTPAAGEPARFLVHDNQDGTVDFVIFDADDEAWAETMTAAASLYPGWVELDHGSFSETGEYVTFGPEYMTSGPGENL
jgi:hypothetical protein